jgi:hypothetical protein
MRRRTFLVRSLVVGLTEWLSREGNDLVYLVSLFCLS